MLQEKQLLQKKKKEIEEAEEARKRQVILTFDLVGRKVSCQIPLCQPILCYDNNLL